mgnify:CR=1 FL=1
MTSRTRPREGEDWLIRALFFLVLLAGVIVRVWRFGAVPDGLNQDEAFAGYEAWCLLATGRDAFGRSLPVYLTAWGSGMNALESYLMLPFLALFGRTALAVRLPQLLVGVLSLPAAYGVAKRTAGRWAGLCGMLLLAVCPWHVMLSRWGLESNLAPGFLLFGLYFFLRGLEDCRWLPLSALMYGLALYCYAAIWPFVPLILLLQGGYALWCGKLRLRGRDGAWAWASAALLLALALPLLLFLLVNWGLLPELHLGPFTVPKLVVMRDSEFSLSRLPAHAARLLDIFRQQGDSLPWNGTERFGLFYYGTLPLALAGLVWAVRETWEGLSRREVRPAALLVIQLAAGLLQGLTLNANVNRVNTLWIPVVLLAGLGAWALCGRLDPRALAVPLLIYAALFVRFAGYYFTDYAQETRQHFGAGLEQAVDAALSQEGEIRVARSANYARVLFYSGQEPWEYRDTVRYTNYPSAFLDVEGFGRFRFLTGLGEPDPACVYVVEEGPWTDALRAAGFTVEQFDCWAAAYWE